jgi:hypothetical protein
MMGLGCDILLEKNSFKMASAVVDGCKAVFAGALLPSRWVILF